MGATLRALAALAAVATLIALVGATGAVAQESPQERLVVEVEADGDATVTTVYVYDLTDDGERASFAALEDERGNLSATYAQRLRAVADGVGNETGREMAIQDASASIDRRGDVGVVRLSTTWTNLAAIEDDRLVLAAPFDDGFDPDRPLVVRAPDGEEITNTAVEPTEHSDGQATWSTERDLSGFQATMTGADAGGGDALAPSLAVPVLGLLAGGALVAARRRISH
jgi:hypothetical protein